MYCGINTNITSKTCLLPGNSVAWSDFLYFQEFLIWEENSGIWKENSGGKSIVGEAVGVGEVAVIVVITLFIVFGIFGIGSGDGSDII